jgi:hypothetical protein
MLVVGDEQEANGLVGIAIGIEEGCTFIQTTKLLTQTPTQKDHQRQSPP